MPSFEITFECVPTPEFVRDLRMFCRGLMGSVCVTEDPRVVVLKELESPKPALANTIIEFLAENEIRAIVRDCDPVVERPADVVSEITMTSALETATHETISVSTTKGKSIRRPADAVLTEWIGTPERPLEIIPSRAPNTVLNTQERVLPLFDGPSDVTSFMQQLPAKYNFYKRALKQCIKNNGTNVKESDHWPQKCVAIGKCRGQFKLGRVFPRMDRGGQRVSVSESDIKNDKELRYINSGGLSSMPREIKNTLLRRRGYIDIDCVSAHPSLCLALAGLIPKETRPDCTALLRLVNERDAVYDELATYFGYFDREDCRKISKQFAIRVLFGGKVSTWVNDNHLTHRAPMRFAVELENCVQQIARAVIHSNPVAHATYTSLYGEKASDRGFLALVLQSVEGVLTRAALDAVIRLDNSIANTYSWAWDGFSIRPTSPIDSTVLLAAANVAVGRALSCIQPEFRKIQYVIKPFEKCIDLVPLVVSDGSVAPDDEAATSAASVTSGDDDDGTVSPSDYLHFARAIIEKGHHLIRAGTRDGDLYMFDCSTGMWSNNAARIRYTIRFVEPFAMKDVPLRKGKRVEYIFRGHASHLNEVMKHLYDILHSETDPTWEQRTSDSSLGYMLYRNGYYDWRRDAFHREFNPEIRFFSRCEFDFLEEDNAETQALEADILDFFSKPYPNLAMRDHLLYMFAIALFAPSGLLRKKVAFLIGPTNSGKSVLLKILQAVFGEGLVSQYEISNLCRSDAGGRENHRQFGWLMGKERCRILMSQETLDPGANRLSVKKLKQLSGNDSVGTVLMNQNSETSLRPHAIMFMASNPPGPAFSEEDVKDPAFIDTRGNFIEQTRSASSSVSVVTDRHFPCVEEEELITMWRCDELRKRVFDRLLRRISQNMTYVTPECVRQARMTYAVDPDVVLCQTVRDVLSKLPSETKLRAEYEHGKLCVKNGEAVHVLLDGGKIRNGRALASKDVCIHIIQTELRKKLETLPPQSRIYAVTDSLISELDRNQRRFGNALDSIFGRVEKYESNSKRFYYDIVFTAQTSAALLSRLVDEEECE